MIKLNGGYRYDRGIPGVLSLISVEASTFSSVTTVLVMTALWEANTESFVGCHSSDSGLKER